MGDKPMGNGQVKCGRCGCAFVPEPLEERDGDIEFAFFRCSFCGKAYMVSVTDSQLRDSIAEYGRLAERNREERFPEPEQRRMQSLKDANVQRARELRKLYLKEDGNGRE